MNTCIEKGEGKMKKRFLVMLCVLSFACIQFTGCGQDEKKDSEKAKTVEETKETEETTAKDEEKKEQTEEETQKITAKRGMVEDGVYKNEAFGVSFPVSENLTVCTDEQIAKNLNLGQELLKEEGKYSVNDMEEVMQGAMYDTVIMFSDNRSNVSVVYENMDLSQSSGLDEEQYAKAVADMLNSMEVMNYKAGEITKQDIGGTEFTALSAKADEYNQKYFLHQVGNYMVEFIFTYTNDSEEEVENFISSISYENPL